MQAMVTEKFLFLETIYRQLTNWGMGGDGANFVTFLIACAVLVFLIWLLKLVFSRLLSTVLRALIRHGHSKLDYFLQKRKFYQRLINFIAVIIIIATSQILFQGFGQEWIRWADRIIYIYSTIVVLLLCFSILNTVNDVYETKPQAQYRSIRSMIQTVEIILSVLAGIVIIIILVGQESVSASLAYIGAFAAVIALIFRDPILGFVASIQVSVQDMFRPGDWVEIPSKNANGRVEEINVMNIKVRNFDNSVSMIPTYTMISESFTNWRNMQESAGRRFKRPLLIDINSLRTVGEEEAAQMLANPLIDPEIARQTMQLFSDTNTNPFITNFGLYRSYVEALLNNHPKINQNHLRLVRYLDNSEYGITLQLYAFSLEKMLFDYEHIISDIFENIMIVAQVFNIKMYQRPIADLS